MQTTTTQKRKPLIKAVRAAAEAIIKIDIRGGVNTAGIKALVVTLNREYIYSDENGKERKTPLRESVHYFTDEAGDGSRLYNSYVAFYNDVFDSVAEVSLTGPKGRTMIINVEKNAKDLTDIRAVIMAIAIIGREFSFCMKIV